MVESNISPEILTYGDSYTIDYSILIAILIIFVFNVLFVKRNMITIKNSIIYLLIGIVIYFLGYIIIMFEISNGIIYHTWKFNIAFICNIVSIIIQFIPLILALRKKKNKEDEVKKENV